MSVQYLTDTNFTLSGGHMLCNVQAPIMFVMFKTENCAYCQQTAPIFFDLSQREIRTKWAIADVSKYRNIIAMAKASSTPLRAVPMMILYINGRPHANYKGKRTAQHIYTFLNKILSSINTNRTFAQPQQPPTGGSNPYPQPSYQPAIDGNVQMQPMPPGSEIRMPGRVKPHNEPWRST